MPRRRLDAHKDSRRLRYGILLARDDDLADTRLTSIVVFADEPHRAIPRAGIVTAHKRDPRLRHDCIPHGANVRRNAKFTCAVVALHHRPIRADGKIIWTLGNVHLLVADLYPSNPR